MTKITFPTQRTLFSSLTNLEAIVAVIDVVRMIVLHPDGAAKLMQHVKDQDGTNEISSVIIHFTFFFTSVSPNSSCCC